MAWTTTAWPLTSVCRWCVVTSGRADFRLRECVGELKPKLLSLVPQECLVDEDGRFTELAGAELQGLAVMSHGTDRGTAARRRGTAARPRPARPDCRALPHPVICMLRDRGALVQEQPCVHSYPYDWRTKQPVIIRPSRQWFIDTAALKDKAKVKLPLTSSTPACWSCWDGGRGRGTETGDRDGDLTALCLQEALQKVQVLPESARASLLAMLDRRTYWCISRQRRWGVPIPVFYHKQTGEALLNK